MAQITLSCSSGNAYFKQSAQLIVTYTALNEKVTITEIQAKRGGVRSWEGAKKSITVAVGGVSKTVSLSHYVDFPLSWVSWGATDTTWTGVSGDSINIHITMPSSTTEFGGAVFSGNIAMSRSTYTISYNANGGTGAPASHNYTYASSGVTYLSSTIPKRTGYTFLGWAISSTATTAGYSAGQAWARSNASNYLLYAVWRINKAQIAYHPNGGVIGAPDYGKNQYGWVTYQGDVYFHKVNYGTTDDTYNIATFGLYNTGFTFGGWKNKYNGQILNQDTKYDSTVYCDHSDGTTTAIQDVTCYLEAVWNRNTYSVTFDLNGGDSGGGIIKVLYQDSYTVPTAKKSGYKFLGWFDSNGRKVYNGGELEAYAHPFDSVYYAHWEVLGSVHIDNGTLLQRYFVYIDNGASWDRYVPYIDNGTNWNIIN